MDEEKQLLARALGSGEGRTISRRTELGGEGDLEEDVLHDAARSRYERERGADREQERGGGGVRGKNGI
jgi:hypothetical protein